MAWLRERASGQRLGVASGHFDEASAPGPDAQRRAARSAGWTSPTTGPGSCSATSTPPPTTRPCSCSLDSGYRDTLGDLPASRSGAGTEHAFSGRDDGKRIDFVLVPALWRVPRPASCGPARRAPAQRPLAGGRGRSPTADDPPPRRGLGGPTPAREAVGGDPRTPPPVVGVATTAAGWRTRSPWWSGAAVLVDLLDYRRRRCARVGSRRLPRHQRPARLVAGRRPGSCSWPA